MLKSPLTSPRSPRVKKFTNFLKNYNFTFKKSLDDVWTEFDTDNDGFLQKDEAKKFLEQVQQIIQEDR